MLKDRKIFFEGLLVTKPNYGCRRKMNNLLKWRCQEPQQNFASKFTKKITLDFKIETIRFILT